MMLFLRHLIDASKGEVESRNRPMGIIHYYQLVGRMLYPSMHKNPVTGEQKTIKEQVRCFEKRIFNLYGVQELCHWVWIG
jgi:hypothetical protein